MRSRSRAFGYARRGLGAHAAGSPRLSRRLGRAPEIRSLGTLRFALAGLGGRRRTQPRLRHAPFGGGHVLGRTSARFKEDSTRRRNVSGGLHGTRSSCGCLCQVELGTLHQALRPDVYIAHEDGHDLPIQLDIYQAGFLNLSADLNLGPGGNRDRPVPIFVPIFHCLDRDEWRHYSVGSSHMLLEPFFAHRVLPVGEGLQRGDLDLGAGSAAHAQAAMLRITAFPRLSTTIACFILAAPLPRRAAS
jgi:hypothetical protein